MSFIYYSLVINCLAFGPYGQDITPLVVEISAQDDERLHVKIYDPNESRWEVPARYDIKVIHVHHDVKNTDNFSLE